MQTIIYDTHKFSAGEINVTLATNYNPLGPDEPICLRVTDYTAEGFMELCQVAEILRRLYDNPKIWVEYPYFPFSRQDRVMEKSPRQSFSLKVFANLLNSQGFDKVITWDPHSSVTPALINNVEVINQDYFVYFIPELWAKLEDPDTVIVAPDAGAYKKVVGMAKDPNKVVVATKIRGADGSISHTEILNGTDLEGKSCVIIDDICDGGRTFIGIAEALKARGANKYEIDLFVTHGIFSRGADCLIDAGIDTIYTTNSFPATDCGNVNVLSYSAFQE